MTETKITRARLVDDKVYIINPDGTETSAPKRIDYAKLDATTEEDIARQIAEDEAEARADAAAWRRWTLAMQLDTDQPRLLALDPRAKE